MGTNFGENGFVRMEIANNDYVGTCGMNQYILYVI